ncbi:MAG TPA: adenosylcobinamide-GDP ribazoletransferase [Chloroflexota bacterium]|jgi:adenosylcobinamide-GDP ribazoletransferase|nr:adenosylcobinamide-GDP ribazoletransferase [Chloroflexota bacterium]
MSLLVALQFLTRLPLPAGLPIAGPALGRALGWFPLVGALLGAVLAAADWALSHALPRGLVDVLLLALLALLTGGLHLDGFMDTCDGLFSLRSPEERLAIFRDSRVGSFGVVGLTTLLLLQWAALGALPSAHRAGCLIVALATARWAMVYAIVAFPYGRAEGLGRVFKDQAGPHALLVATALGALIAGGVLGGVGLVTLALAALIAWLFARYCLGRLPGLTGDTYGALNELVQTLLLVLLPPLLRGQGAG